MAKQTERRHVDPETGEGLIIDNPSMISGLRYYSEWAYNLAAWSLWLWFILLRPLLILAVWYLGVRIAWFQMVELEGFKNPTFFMYGFFAILGIFVLMFAWNRYNFFRFVGKERRKSRGEASPSDFAGYYKTAEENIAALHNASNVDIYFPGNETIVLDHGNDKKIEALYAPLNLKKHFKSEVDEQKNQARKD